MSKTVMLTAAALLMGSLVAVAQTGQTGKTGQGGQTGQTGKTDKPAPAPTAPPQKPADTTLSMTLGKGPYVHTADQLIGMEVKNAADEKLGKIEDVVFYSSGEVAYAVLSFGGVLGMGDKLFAIPWSCMATTDRTDRTTRDEHVVLNVDKDKLKSAPGFDKNNWPKLADVAWCADVDKYYAGEKHAKAVEASAHTASTLTLRASELKGKNLETATGDKLGDIKEVAIDPSNARVNYVAVSVGGFLGIGDKLVAVPWEAIKVTRDGDKEKLTLPITKDKLEKAPEFKSGEAAWKDMSDPIYIGRVYEFYAVRPYWSDTGAPKVDVDKTKEKKEKD